MLFFNFFEMLIMKKYVELIDCELIKMQKARQHVWLFKMYSQLG